MKTLPQRQAQPPIGNYLEGEQSSDIRHEYLAGQVVAMEGATRTHALIAGSLHAALLPAARRKGCQLFMADMKVRIDHADESYFYYPDVVLSCATADRHPLYTALPCLIVRCSHPAPNASTRAKSCLPTACCPACANTCCCARTGGRPTCTSGATKAVGSIMYWASRTTRWPCVAWMPPSVCAMCMRTCRSCWHRFFVPGQSLGSRAGFTHQAPKFVDIRIANNCYLHALQ